VKRNIGATIAFQAPIKNDKNPLTKKGEKQMALIGNRYKLLSFDSGQSFHLFDIIDDPTESKDIAKSYPKIIKQMRRQLDEWIQSCINSAKGNDYE
jgi:hypothetical protein